MKLNVLTILLMAILMVGCVTIKPERIRFNSEKEIYEYPVSSKNSITLRNEYQQLVDTSNYEQFKNELITTKRRYPFKKRIEKDNSLKNSDFELTRRYGLINHLILEGDYQKSIHENNELTSLYPEITKYSDSDFLKGYAFEKLGLEDSAKIMYGNFLKYSSQKLSSRFRGYRDFDSHDSLFIEERIYATNYRLNREPVNTVHLYPIKPKYYYGSNQPGYTLNSEDLEKGSRGFLMFLFGTGTSGEFAGGYQYYYKINERFNINPRYGYAPNSKEFTLAAPIQIHKSEDNKFGLKFTPFVSYLTIDTIKIDGTKYLLDDNLLNFGARISAGYYLAPQLALGAYYQYNYYNKTNTFKSKQQIELWLINEYDVSLYYNIFNGFSLKTGVKNNDLVAGFFWNCWEISYNISNPGLIMRVDMY